ncbi:hypothetical protein Tco_0025744 [Tanacetum coccineum]
MKIMINDESDISDYEEDDLNILEEKSTSDNESEACECVGKALRKVHREIDVELRTKRILLARTKLVFRPTAKAFQAKPIACPKYETADMINSQVLAMFSSESYTYRSHDEAIPHGNNDGNVFSQLITKVVRCNHHAKK